MKKNTHCFLISQIKDGSMSLTGHEIFDCESRQNRFIFLNKNDINPGLIITGQLVHSKNVAVVSHNHKGASLKETDGLITGDKETYLAVTAADCFPVSFFDPINEVIGIAHCGWRGVAAGIVEEMINKMKREFNCLPRNIFVTMGPGIRQCHFEVDGEVKKKFDKYPKFITTRYLDGDRVKYQIALDSIIEQKLIEYGIIGTHINWKESLCTYCSKDKYFSWRRDKSSPLKSQLAVVGMKEKAV